MKIDKNLTLLDNHIGDISRDCQNKDIVETLQYLAKRFKGNIVFSTSLSFEDQVVTDMIFKNNIPIKVFTLDTGRHFNETYKTLSSTLSKYKKKIYTYFPDASKVEGMMNEKGPFSFYESIENRKECCFIRKVEPLQRALAGMKCWVTGLRASQSNARNTLDSFQWDENNELIKYNPLSEWSFEDVKKYISENDVPYNSLQDKGFLSIGCAPCTRAVAPGEDIRAGRWWWEDNSKKECGLHAK